MSGSDKLNNVTLVRDSNIDHLKGKQIWIPGQYSMNP